MITLNALLLFWPRKGKARYIHRSLTITALEGKNADAALARIEKYMWASNTLKKSEQLYLFSFFVKVLRRSSRSSFPHRGTDLHDIFTSCQFPWGQFCYFLLCVLVLRVRLCNYSIRLRVCDCARWDRCAVVRRSIIESV